MKRSRIIELYHDYLTVIYGLVATMVLLDFRDSWNKHELSGPKVLAYLVCFLIAVRFWYVCSLVDNSAHEFYELHAGPRKSVFSRLVLVDTFFVKAFGDVAKEFGYEILNPIKEPDFQLKPKRKIELE